MIHLLLVVIAVLALILVASFLLAAVVGLVLGVVKAVRLYRTGKRLARVRREIRDRRHP